MRRLGLGFSLLVSFSSAAGAGVVSTTADSGVGSLRAVIAAAPPGDTITFSLPLPNTIALTSGEIAIVKNLTITGPGAVQLAISGNDISRIFNIAPATTVSIQDLAIVHGRVVPSTGPGQGGCILSSGSLTLERVVVANCLAMGAAPIDVFQLWPGQGGGVAVLSGSLTVDDSTIETNRAVGGEQPKAEAGHGQGGGIWTSPEAPISVLITDTTIRSNVALGGATVLPSGCAVGGNGEGGGLAASGSVTVERSTFDGNTAEGGDAFSDDGDELGGGGGGGGLFQDGGSISLTNATFSGNTAVGGDLLGPVVELLRADPVAGGARREPTGFFGRQIFCSGSAPGAGAGGGLVVNELDGTLVHLTVAGNSAVDSFGPGPGLHGGGGIFAGDASLDLGQTIISGNSAPFAPDVLLLFGATVTSSGYNLISTAPFGPAFAVPTDDVGNGTDPLLGPLADNGGATETRAIAASSPAKDAIPPADCTVAEDQRTVARPQGLGCDIGAFELIVSLLEIPALSGRGLALFAALLAGTAAALLRRV